MKIKEKKVAIYGRYYKSTLFEDVGHYSNKIIKYMNRHKDLRVQAYYQDCQGKIKEFYKLVTSIFEEKVDVLIVLGGIKTLPDMKYELWKKIVKDVEIVEIY